MNHQKDKYQLKIFCFHFSKKKFHKSNSKILFFIFKLKNYISKHIFYSPSSKFLKYENIQVINALIGFEEKITLKLKNLY